MNQPSSADRRRLPAERRRHRPRHLRRPRRGPVVRFKPNQRYPDPAVQILDPSFARYRIYSSTLEQVASGMRWAEGPVYFRKAATCW
jgi:gluconolactonase